MSSLAEGQTLDDTYRLLRLIGEGGMGAVYEATHARLAGRYAVKVLLGDLSRDPDAVARFNREARVTSLLQHPNIVQVVDHNTAPDGTEYLAMEYLDGESLAQRVARTGRPPIDEVVSIVSQIAAGLAAAHAHGIVHRDLKPDNVYLVRVEGHEGELVKLLDFGISKLSGGQHTKGRQICGTPQYMAPEQVEARPADIGPATDQFALAAIAYEMLTGRNPFAGPNLATIFERVLREQPAPTGFSEAVDEALARGLSKRPEDRHPSVADFADALRAALLPAGPAVDALSFERLGEGGAGGERAGARPWRRALVLVSVVLASLAVMLVLRTGWARRVWPGSVWWRVASPAAVSAETPPPAARPPSPPRAWTAAPVPPPAVPRSGPDQPVAAKAAPTPTALASPPPVGTEVRGREPAAAHAGHTEEARSPARPRPASHAPRARPRARPRPPANHPLSDEDDVLPLSETFDTPAHGR